VTDSAGGPGPDAARETRRQAGRVLATFLRAFASTVGLVALYYLLPLSPGSVGVAVAMLTVGLLALVGLVAFQVRAIIKAAYPALRAVGALATSVPLFLLLFAGTYFVMGNLASDSFSESMTRTDALYFTVTVFATVGFGDITPVTEGARALVTGQMVAGIVILGLGVRIIVDAVKRGQQRPPGQTSDAASPVESPLE
jgi:voltage-gated potassium channel